MLLLFQPVLSVVLCTTPPTVKGTFGTWIYIRQLFSHSVLSLHSVFSESHSTFVGADPGVISQCGHCSCRGEKNPVQRPSKSRPSMTIQGSQIMFVCKLYFERKKNNYFTCALIVLADVKG